MANFSSPSFYILILVFLLLTAGPIAGKYFIPLSEAEKEELKKKAGLKENARGIQMARMERMPAMIGGGVFAIGEVEMGSLQEEAKKAEEKARELRQKASQAEKVKKESEAKAREEAKARLKEAEKNPFTPPPEIQTRFSTDYYTIIYHASAFLILVAASVALSEKSNVQKQLFLSDIFNFISTVVLIAVYFYLSITRCVPRWVCWLILSAAFTSVSEGVSDIVMGNSKVANLAG